MAKPLLTCLSYSAGVQSHGILRMVLAGMIPRPDRFAVAYADPGMESHVSYQFADWAEKACAEAGIPFLRAAGPNLFEDVLTLRPEATRLDTPPLWTAGERRDVGNLTQKCTAHYKIAPIKRAVRSELYRRWGIHPKSQAALSPGCVEQWIGFTADEASRVEGQLLDPKNPAYVRFAYPLVGMGMTKSDVVRVYEENDWPIPVRSMCVACPWHGLRSLKEMHDERPEDWERAVQFDEAIRDLSQLGVRNPCYVSKTLRPLRELAQIGFRLEDRAENEAAQCPSGVCFV